jgi:hypothetical protein
MKLDSNLSHVEIIWLTALPTIVLGRMLETPFIVITIKYIAGLDHRVTCSHTGFSSENARFLFLNFLDLISSPSRRIRSIISLSRRMMPAASAAFSFLRRF